ncbi:MAG TPA: ABC transporter permease [Xanthobacteraceae bacterium]|nr:ABC transporter permease [Xanthobacteraceae bacterium]
MAGVEQTAACRPPARRALPELRLAARLRACLPFLMIALLLAAWEIVAHSPLVTPFMLPPIEAVADRLVADAAGGDVVRNLSATLARTAIGFSLAAAVGIALGILMVHNRIVFWFFDPVISAGFPVPKVALLPIFILWFGLYDVSKIMLIAANAVFPVVTATVLGLRGVDRHLIWSARSLGAGERRIAWEIVLPAALPQILTGLQIALPISLIVAIVSEIVMSGDGLGGAMMEGARSLDSPAVFAGIVEIAAAGYCLVKLVELARRRLLVWHSETTTNFG